jgi:hypothetical protein
MLAVAFLFWAAVSRCSLFQRGSAFRCGFRVQRTRNIGFLVFPDFQILDLTGPLAAFEISARTVTPKPYRLHVVSCWVER